MIQYAQALSNNPIIYWHLAENKNVDNFVKNGRWSYPNPVLGIPPSRPRQFRNSEIISYFALDKEQKAKDKAADAIKKWITQEVSINVWHVSFKLLHNIVLRMIKFVKIYTLAYERNTEGFDQCSAETESTHNSKCNSRTGYLQRT